MSKIKQSFKIGLTAGYASALLYSVLFVPILLVIGIPLSSLIFLVGPIMLIAYTIFSALFVGLINVLPTRSIFVKSMVLILPYFIFSAIRTFGLPGDIASKMGQLFTVLIIMPGIFAISYKLVAKYMPGIADMKTWMFVLLSMILFSIAFINVFLGLYFVSN